MYKSEEHRVMTERWVNNMKSIEYAESTLARKILDRNTTPKMVFDSLRGASGAEKARILMREFNGTATTTDNKLVWDERVVVPMGTKIKTGALTSGNAVYTLTSVKDNNSAIITPQSSSSGVTYSIINLNQYLRNRTWNIVDATDEHYKIIGKPPKQLFKLGNSNNGAYNPTISEGPYKGINVGFLYPGPTSNCQLCLLGSAQNLLSYMKDPEQLKNAFKELAKAAGKRIVLMDIKTSLVAGLQSKLPSNALILNSRYKSTNNSDMSIVIVNTTAW